MTRMMQSVEQVICLISSFILSHWIALLCRNVRRKSQSYPNGKIFIVLHYTYDCRCGHRSISDICQQ